MLKQIIKIVIKLTLFVVGLLGIIFSASSTSFMGNGFVFMFFTVQSNIFIMVMSLLFMVNDVLVMLNKKPFVNQVLMMIKFVATVAITITFLVFFTMLAPTLGVDYLLSFNNFSLHAIVPILALVDFFIFDKDIHLTYLNSLLGVLSPVCYFLFFLIGIPLGFRYTADGLKAPYFFLNYEEIGWFTITGKGPGILLWVLILVILISGLCVLFAFLMRLRQGKIRKNN